MKLESSELAQLLELFYDLREEDDVVVDTDTAPLEEISTSSAAGGHDGTQTGQVRVGECVVVVIGRAAC